MILAWVSYMGGNHSYLLVVLRGEVVPYRRKIFVLGWFVSKKISWRTPRACFVLRISFVISFNVYHRPLYYAYGNIIDIGPWNCPACLPGASPQAFWSLKCLDQLNFFLQILWFVFNISNILCTYIKCLDRLTSQLLCKYILSQDCDQL